MCSFIKGFKITENKDIPSLNQEEEEKKLSDSKYQSFLLPVLSFPSTGFNVDYRGDSLKVGYICSIQCEKQMQDAKFGWRKHEGPQEVTHY